MKMKMGLLPILVCLQVAAAEPVVKIPQSQYEEFVKQVEAKVDEADKLRTMNESLFI